MFRLIENPIEMRSLSPGLSKTKNQENATGRLKYMASLIRPLDMENLPGRNNSSELEGNVDEASWNSSTTRSKHPRGQLLITWMY